MDDLVTRLRNEPKRSARLSWWWFLCDEAADEIERLKGEWRRMDLNLQAKVAYCNALERRNAELVKALAERQDDRI